MKPQVGVSALRQEGPGKVSGLAKYVDDYSPPGLWHGVTVRSTIPAGIIRKISFDPAFPWNECVIATAKDIPGKNIVALITDDQPLLVETEVRHPAEPILLIAHPSRVRAYEAAKHVHIEYEAFAPVLTIEESVAGKRVFYGEDNVFKSFLIEKGNVERALAAAEVVVEGEYRVGHQEQAYIENNGIIGSVEKDGTVTVMGSMQCPHYVLKAMMKIFGRPEDKIRVVQTTTGGGFGGKEEYPNMIAGHAALLALKAGRPVKIMYDRAEDMPATTKRHPAVVRHKTGLTRAGKLVAQDVEVVMDGGAYVTLSPVVLSRGTLHATGAYECPNVRVSSKVVATNTPPNGAFRGFGAPQTLFAAELHWEKIAKVLGIDSLTLRRKNLFKEGSVTATGQVLKESVGASECLERCVQKSRYEAKRAECEKWNQDPKKPTWRGMGLAVVFHGGGFTGAGEVMLQSQAGVALTREGRLRVLAGSTEIGQGTETMFAQIAAETLGVPVEWVDVATPDTADVPNSGPTVASRTCMVVGKLVERAARELLEAVKNSGIAFKTRADLSRAGKALCDGSPERRFIAQYEKPPEIHWDEKAYRGDAYGAYSYAAAAAEVEVDRTTFEVSVRKITTAQDIGKAINPLLAEGQIIGGTAQAFGYAVLEHAVYKDGVMQNGQFTNYIIPTALDTPPMDVSIVEKPYSRGPFGAKGVGELPMDVPPPAIAAALSHATGLWFPELPVTPEKIHEAYNETDHA